MRRADVFLFGTLAGRLAEEAEGGFTFQYDRDYIARPDAIPVSARLPLRAEPYRSRFLFPFFDGLIPEGWLLNVATQSWKLDPNDRMGLLMACCKDCIGAASIREVAP
ncbi:MAG: HipA N-terminal domain-containing protein [Kiritimatiellia bacterium]|jgi:serine/threonine-protein kinase HipA